MSHLVYKPKSSNKVVTYALLCGAGMVALIYLILPLTQLLERLTQDTPEIQRAQVYTPPPPPPPPPPIEDEEPPPPDEPPPQLAEPPPPISISQLQVGLAAGTGGAGIATGMDFSQNQPDVMDVFFELSELDRVPRAKRRGRLVYPPEMRRDRVEGRVVLLVEINEEGRVRVIETRQATHREFVQAAIDSAEGSLFESPTRGGQPVKTRFLLPIDFSMQN
ncbi:MAG: energy transducer TonB [Verrucomicrobiota bacterium]